MGDINDDVKAVKEIRFQILSPADIQKSSVVSLDSSGVTLGNGIRLSGDLFDKKMGTIERGVLCHTCLQDSNNCPGHMGCINLAYPVFHLHYMDTIMRILKCVCLHCGRLLRDPHVHPSLLSSTSNAKRADATAKECANIKRCDPDRNTEAGPGCGQIVPKVTFDKGISRVIIELPSSEDPMAEKGMRIIDDNNQEVTEDKKAPKRIYWTAREVLNLFRLIPPDDAKALGFVPGNTHPSDLICQVLPVVPPAVRPPIRSDMGSRQNDDLTHYYTTILRHNDNIKQDLHAQNGHLTSKLLGNIDNLQVQVGKLVDSKNASGTRIRQSGEKPMRGLGDRLKGKEGRVRGNLMGKRVDQSARSVITPDPFIEIDELGMPLTIAMNLTFPEVVNAYNEEDMRRLVERGAQEYPGAKNVSKPHRKKSINDVPVIKYYNFQLTSGTKLCRNARENLKHGDIVHRHLRDGDPVLFNRQPSLHRMSMMCHRVRVMPGDTFRLNPCVVKPYNADFDGDEMNLHVPQSRQTSQELLQLASVPTQIITPRESKPIISVVQDVTSGSYRLTKSSTIIDPKIAFNLMAMNPKCNTLISNAYRYATGQLQDVRQVERVLAELLFRSHAPIPGRLLMSTILPPDVFMDDKPEEAVNTDDEHILINNGYVEKGALVSKTFQQQTKGIVHQIYNEHGPMEAKRLFDRLQPLVCEWFKLNGFSMGMSDIVVSNDTQAKFEEIIEEMKRKVYRRIADVHEGRFRNESARSAYDHFEHLINNELNSAIRQIGDQALRDVDPHTNRMMNMVVSGAKGDKIKAGQMMGCVGQQNLGGVRIPYGFTDRTLPHFTKYDDGPEARGFISNSFKSGLNPTEFFWAAQAGREGLIDTAVNTSDTGYIQRRLIKALEDLHVNFTFEVRDAANRIIQFLYGNDGMNSTKIEKQNYDLVNMTQQQVRDKFDYNDGSVQADQVTSYVEQVLQDRQYFAQQLKQGKQDPEIEYPVAFKRLIKIVSEDSQGPPLSVKDVFEGLEKIEQNVYITRHQPGNTILMLLARRFLCPRELIKEMTKPAFDRLVNTIQGRFEESLVSPAELVGIEAAQSIGEPATQLVLNTFHASGISAASRTVRGVPRLNELLRMSKNIKTPIMKVKFAPEVNDDAEACKKIMNNVRTIYLRDVVRTVAIIYDPHEQAVSQDVSFVSMQRELLPLEEPISPWLLRIELDRASMLDFTLTMLDVELAIHNKNPGKYDIISSGANDEQMVIRLRIKMLEPSKDMLTDLRAVQAMLINDLSLSGIEGITHATVELEEGKAATRFDPQTQEFVSRPERWMITEGSNMLDIMSVPGIDQTRVFSNHVSEVYQTLGIEAARRVLHDEIKLVLADIHVNYRHIALLVDAMTNKGVITSVDRHGINRGDAGTLSKCSFEETTTRFMKAGLYSEVDKMTGVSANVMLGQIAPMGTGMSKVYMNDRVAPQAPPSYESVEPAPIQPVKDDRTLLDEDPIFQGI